MKSFLSKKLSQIKNPKSVSVNLFRSRKSGARGLSEQSASGRLIGPIDRRREPEIKGGVGRSNGWKFGSACPGGCALVRLPGQPLPDLTRVKSSKKKKGISGG